MKPVCVNLKVMFGEIIQLYYDKSTEWEIFTKQLLLLQ